MNRLPDTSHFLAVFQLWWIKSVATQGVAISLIRAKEHPCLQVYILSRIKWQTLEIALSKLIKLNTDFINYKKSSFRNYDMKLRDTLSTTTINMVKRGSKELDEVTVDNSPATITYWSGTPFVSGINQVYFSDVQSRPAMPVSLSLLTPLQHNPE